MVNYLSEAGHELFKSQILNNGVRPSGRRFSYRMKIFCLGLYSQSPKAYRHLQEVLILPSTTTLETVKSGFRLKPGISDSIKRALTLRCSKMSEEQKNCIVSMDEMNIKTELSYRKEVDKIEGFVDYDDLVPQEKAYATKLWSYVCRV